MEMKDRIYNLAVFLHTASIEDLSMSFLIKD